MPFEHEIDKKNGILCKHGTGEVSDEDFRAQLVAEANDPSFRPGLLKIADYQHLKPSWGSEGVRRIAATVRELEDRIGDTRWAIVSNNNVVYGLTRMFIAVTEGSRVEVGVFRDIQDARTWLGLPGDYRCPLAERHPT